MLLFINAAGLSKHFSVPIRVLMVVLDMGKLGRGGYSFEVMAVGINC